MNHEIKTSSEYILSIHLNMSEFYLENMEPNIESFEEEKKSNDKLSFKSVKSVWIEPNIEKKNNGILIYSCLYCDGENINNKGLKPCEYCNGTGIIPESFLNNIRSIIKKELNNVFKLEQNIAISQLNEKSKTFDNNFNKRINSLKSHVYTECIDNMEFIANITTESITNNDDKEKTEIIKIIIVKNDGVNSWPKDTRFVKLWGDNMDATVSYIGKIEPNETKRIKLKVRKPEKPGHYFANFGLKYGKDEKFSAEISMDFILDEHYALHVMK